MWPLHNKDKCWFTDPPRWGAVSYGQHSEGCGMLWYGGNTGAHESHGTDGYFRFTSTSFYSNCSHFIYGANSVGDVSGDGYDDFIYYADKTGGCCNNYTFDAYIFAGAPN